MFGNRKLRISALKSSMIRRLMPAKQKATQHSNCVTVQAYPLLDCFAKMIETYQKKTLAEACLYFALGERYTVNDDCSTQLA
jgi:propanediol dehydratase small subunit